MQFQYLAKNEQETARLGQALADVLPPGTVVALLGTLGAGKTRLVQAVAAAMGIPQNEVTSPTFVLINQYTQGRLPIYHFDAYRLADADEFLELGPEEYFDAGGLTFVEWADRVASCLPTDAVEVRIEVLGATERKFFVRANSPKHANMIAELTNRLPRESSGRDGRAI